MQDNIKNYTLENGLQVYFLKDSKKHNVEVNLVVKFGGLDKDFLIDGKEVRFCDGMAHLLEHYTLEASEYGLLMQQFNKRYMYSNGYTNKFRTLYFFNAVKYVDEGLELLIKGIHKPDFTNERLDFIKNAIREEIRMTRDSRSRRLLELMVSQLFRKLSYRSVIGTISEIDAITLDEVKKAFKALYIPKNEMIFVSGNFNEEEMLDKIKKLYCELEFETHDVKRISIDEPKEVSKQKEKLVFPVAEPIYQLTFKLDVGKLSNEDQAKLFFYLDIFLDANFSKLSKIYSQLKEENVIKRGIDTDNIMFHRYWLISIGAFTEKKDRLKEVVLDRIKHPIFNKDDYDLLLNEIKMKAVLREEHLSSVMDNLINNITLLDYYHLDDIEFLDKLTFEEYQSFINALDFSQYIETEVVDYEK